MSEEKSAGVKGEVTGWIKAGITSVLGLVGGAFLMYLTPLINNAIKPPKPLANFGAQVVGVTVSFNNQALGATQGWWDFGDGTPLVPFAPKETVVTHTYAKPGTYSVKLSLQNLLGEESERTITINVDTATATSPAIEEFEVIPLIKSERAPATYRVVSKVKNASLCILAQGDDHPLKLDIDSMNQERYVTFEQMGAYTIRLAAVNGKEIVEKAKTVYVGANEGMEPTAKLHVVYDAVKVKRKESRVPIQCVWSGDPKASVSPFREERPVEPGYVITAAEIVNKDDKAAPVQNLKVEIGPNKAFVILTGQLVKPRTLLPRSTLPTWRAEVKLATERRFKSSVVDLGEVTIPVVVNKATKLPMQALEDGWEVVNRRVRFELWDGPTKVLDTDKVVTGAKVTLKGQPCVVTMEPLKDAMTLKIEGTTGVVAPPKIVTQKPAPIVQPPPAKTPITPLVVRPTSFERLPFLPAKK